MRETIAGIATGIGSGGVAIVRVSGPEAARIGRSMAGSLPGPRRVALRTLHDLRGRLLDQGLVLWMPGPRTFTGEDTVEFQVHGGRVVPARVLRASLEWGARPAGPGEFTRRAFLSGRIGLDQAEAICDLVEAESEAIAEQALFQVQGALGERIRSLRDRLIGLAAELEAWLDFPDEDVPGLEAGKVERDLRAIEADLGHLVESGSRARILKAGPSVALVGRPNVGKSSLLNALLGTERAIVTAEPGTTRDLLEEGFLCRGLHLRLLDTAGLRDHVGEAEALGIARTREAIASAAVRVLVTEAGRELDPTEEQLLADLDPERDLLVRNKADLAGAGPAPSIGSLGIGVVSTSATRRTGLVELETAVHARVFASLGGADPSGLMVLRERQRELIEDARAELRGFRGEGLPLDLRLEHLRSASERLGEVVGEIRSEDVLDAIFSRFCIGK